MLPYSHASYVTLRVELEIAARDGSGAPDKETWKIPGLVNSNREFPVFVGMFYSMVHALEPKTKSRYTYSYWDWEDP